VHVWVTRAEPGAARTAEALRRRDHDPLIAPVLEVRPILGARLDLDGVGALAFTSVNGVDAFVALSPRRDLRVFAVGETTAAAARSQGFGQVESAEADVEALAALILARRDEITGEVLHPGPKEPAGDIMGGLQAAGVPARAASLYDTVEAAGLPEPVAAALAQGRLDAVLIHSPKAGRAVARMIAAAGERDRSARLAFLGLSPACIAPLAATGFQISAASEPSEAALLDRLDALVSRP
jgi:uroporphyrinogen-III synthase